MFRFIYFDLGGVVVRDFSASNKWELLRKDLGIREDDKEKFDTLWGNYENKICTSLPVDEMTPLLERKFQASIPANHSLLENFVKYFEKNETIWPVIDEVKIYCKIGLLTSMYVGMLSRIVEKGILPPIHWDVVVDSSIVGFAKPDERIYTIAQEKAHVRPQEILFVDNSRKNLIAAEELGWQTFFYDSSDYSLASKKLLEYFQLQFVRSS